MTPIKAYQDLEIYQLGRKLALEIFEITKEFPKEEKYSLTDQIRRSSRSINANIAEGWGKRNYPDVFKRHLIDSLGSSDETKSWLISSFDCKYISLEVFQRILKEYDRLGGMIYRLHEKWRPLKEVGGRKSDARNLVSDVPPPTSDL